MMETSIIRFSIFDFRFWIGKALNRFRILDSGTWIEETEGDGEGREVGAGGLDAGARDRRTDRKGGESQEHAGCEKGTVDHSGRASVMEAAIEQRVSVIDRKKAGIAESGRGDSSP